MEYKEFCKMMEDMKGMTLAERHDYLSHRPCINESSNNDGYVHLPKGMTFDEFNRIHGGIKLEELTAKIMKQLHNKP